MSAIVHFVESVERLFPIRNVFLLAEKLTERMACDQGECMNARMLRVDEDAEPQDLLLVLLASAVADLRPVLGDRRMHQSVHLRESVAITRSFLAASLSVGKVISRPREDLQKDLAQALGLHVVTFFTSGTSGLPVAIDKTWNQLLEEVATLRSEFRVKAKQRFLSLVPAQHLYGFLFGILLPIFSSCELKVHAKQFGFFDVLSVDWESFDALVVTPSLWSVLRMHLSCVTRAVTLFSSGAAWGQSRFDELRALQNPNIELFDILGSTETGGIAYHKFNRDGLSGLNLLPGVRLKEEDGRWFLYSRYACFAANSDWIELSDQFLIDSNGALKHLGRKDSVFKYAGKRFSLNECEALFKSLLFGADVRCFFIDDENSPKGGKLIAFVSLNGIEVTARELRSSFVAALSKITGNPIPQEIFFLEKFKEDPMGKITFETLYSAAMSSLSDKFARSERGQAKDLNVAPKKN